MRVLGIESSGRFLGVAVVEHGTVLAESVQESDNLVSRRVFPVIHRILEEADTAPEELRGVAVSLGPGRFTGLRVGIAAALGLARGLGAAVAGVPTLDVVARNLDAETGDTMVLLDAGKGRVYAAHYILSGPSKIELVGPYRLMQPEDALLIAPGATLAGEGALLHRSALEAAAGGEVFIAPESTAYPSPSIVALMGAQKIINHEVQGTASLRPIYVRPSEAEEKTGRIMIDVTGGANAR